LDYKIKVGIYMRRKSIFRKKFTIIAIFTALWFSQPWAQQDPEIKIHYLGHSSFVLQFNNGITVVTDYGKENAWKGWGWDSPIHQLNGLVPDVMTYSHTFHEDHYDPERIPEGVEYILKEMDSLTIKGLTIKPIRVCEKKLGEEDNSAYLFSYGGLNLLHLGDAQVQIMNIDSQEVASHIEKIIPGNLDLLLMTIDGPAPIWSQAVKFVEILQPKCVIPMHYWTEEHKSGFLNGCRKLNVGEKKYILEITDAPEYILSSGGSEKAVRIISLKPDDYRKISLPE